ncbi:hypothetical protein FRB97_004942 [Tulasnella sp. 331]|nr:hypothetical protein FRB97_004942 [Tulasnella sp. 331]
MDPIHNNKAQMTEEEQASLIESAQALAEAFSMMDPASAKSFFKSAAADTPDAVAVVIDVQDVLRLVREARSEGFTSPSHVASSCSSSSMAMP